MAGDAKGRLTQGLACIWMQIELLHDTANQWHNANYGSHLGREGVPRQQAQYAGQTRQQSQRHKLWLHAWPAEPQAYLTMQAVIDIRLSLQPSKS